MGHARWPDATGVFQRDACTLLGGAYSRDAKQSLVLQWRPAASGAVADAARAAFSELVAHLDAAASEAAASGSGEPDLPPVDAELVRGCTCVHAAMRQPLRAPDPRARPSLPPTFLAVRSLATQTCIRL